MSVEEVVISNTSHSITCKAESNINGHITEEVFKSFNFASSLYCLFI